MARKTRKPSDMSELFQSSKGTLAQIAAKTNSLTILSDIVRQTCPDLPADVWHIANFKQKSLVIEELLHDLHAQSVKYDIEGTFHCKYVNLLR